MATAHSAELTDERSSRSHDSDVAIFRELLNDATFVLLTSADEDGLLRSRPMTLLEMDETSRLSFFVDIHVDWVAALTPSTFVNCSLVDPENARWVSMAGTASVVRDESEVNRLWTPAAKPFFDGPSDPSLRILRVLPEVVDYWDAPHSGLSRMIGFAKSMVTGERESLGDHGTLDLEAGRTGNDQ